VDNEAEKRNFTSAQLDLYGYEPEETPDWKAKVNYLRSAVFALWVLLSAVCCLLSVVCCLLSPVCVLLSTLCYLS
jgi:hypothetical protein